MSKPDATVHVHIDTDDVARKVNKHYIKRVVELEEVLRKILNQYEWRGVGVGATTMIQMNPVDYERVNKWRKILNGTHRTTDEIPEVKSLNRCCEAHTYVSCALPGFKEPRFCCDRCPERPAILCCVDHRTMDCRSGVPCCEDCPDRSMRKSIDKPYPMPL